jgi:glycosyltransferase involved in cell wall biosynthesis
MFKRRLLNVLFVMPPCLPTPPKGYGGIEAVAAALVPELEAQGASITMTTPYGSTLQVSEKLEITEPLYSILSHPYNEVVPGVELYIARVMDIIHRRKFDVIHDFSGMLSIINTLSAPLGTGNYPPVIHTIHGPIGPYEQSYRLMLKYPRLYYTGISKAQLLEYPFMWPRTRIIHNGLKPAEYPVGRGSSGRLLVLGRICNDKGQNRLVEYCAANELGLDVAGTVAEIALISDMEAEIAKGSASTITGKADFQSFMSFRHLIDGTIIRFHGNVSGDHKSQLLGEATALVVPNRWEEPFGMVAIEAMASGTPVVAMATGAMPELIEHGVTGYLARTWEELCDYLRPEMLAKLDRGASRRHVEANFSIPNLAHQFLDLYAESANAADATSANARAASATESELYEQLPLRKIKRPQIDSD